MFESKVNHIDKENGADVECDAYIFTNFILLARDRKEILRFPLDESSSVKDAPTGKYFKNIIYVTSKKNTLTLACHNSSQKNSLLEALRKTFNMNQDHDGDRVDVDIEGAEERDTLFSKYTVYIVRIKTKSIELKIFPRFSELIEIENLIRKEIPHIDMPHLVKDGWIKTRKTKTIEKRMFLIKDFLLNILNDQKVRNVGAVFSSLGLDLLLDVSLRKQSSSETNTIALSVSLGGWKELNIWIGDKAKVSELKQKIVSLLKMENPTGFEVFEIKDRAKKLVYED